MVGKQTTAHACFTMGNRKVD